MAHRRRSKRLNKEKEDIKSSKRKKMRSRQKRKRTQSTSESSEELVVRIQPTKRKKAAVVARRKSKHSLNVSDKHLDNLTNFLELHSYDFKLPINHDAFLKLQEPLTKLNEMIGMNELKQEILDMVIYYLLKLPEQFTEVMAKVFGDDEIETSRDDSFIEEDCSPEQEEELRNHIRNIFLSRMTGMEQKHTLVKWETENTFDMLEDGERAIVMDVNQNLDMLHTVICGVPGTGKSHVAEIIGEIYVALGFLKPGKPVIHVNAGDFISNHVGETAMKTSELLQSAIGGVLFFDEAYSISGGSNDSFSTNAIDTLTSYLTEHKHDFVMIVAGYEKDLDTRFFGLNKGLRRRFPWKFKIKKYSADELRQIFELMAKKAGYVFPKPVNTSWYESHYDCFPYFGGSMETLLSKVKIVQGRRVIFLDPRYHNEITLADMNAGLQKYCAHSGYDQIKEDRRVQQMMFT